MRKTLRWRVGEGDPPAAYQPGGLSMRCTGEIVDRDGGREIRRKAAEDIVRRLNITEPGALHDKAMAIVEAAVAIRKFPDEPDETYIERHDTVMETYEDAVEQFCEDMENKGQE